jgi:predicted Co/Zn/Cd cation transporter (cation efflux family)
MEKVMILVKWVVEKGPEVIMALNGALVALIAVFALIPGNQPEKALQAVVDFISKFSRKPEKKDAE